MEINIRRGVCRSTTVRPDADEMDRLGQAVRLQGHTAGQVSGPGPGPGPGLPRLSLPTVIEQVVGQGAHHRRIDYVFVGSRLTHPKAQCTIDTAALAFDRPVDGTWASDHFGVVVDLDITTA